MQCHISSLGFLRKSVIEGIFAGPTRARPRPRTKSRTRGCIEWVREEVVAESHATSSSMARLETAAAMADKELAVAERR